MKYTNGKLQPKSSSMQRQVDFSPNSMARKKKASKGSKPPTTRSSRRKAFVVTTTVSIVTAIAVILMWIGNYKAFKNFEQIHETQQQPNHAFLSPNHQTDERRQRISRKENHQQQGMSITGTTVSANTSIRTNDLPREQTKINNRIPTKAFGAQNARKAAERPPKSASLLPLTLYLEPLNTLELNWDAKRMKKPLPNRTTSREKLTKIDLSSSFKFNSCGRQSPIISSIFPIDDVPIENDPYLPWIHDIFPTHDLQNIQIVAQNKRRCDSGEQRTNKMKLMEPQVSLFQPIPIKQKLFEVDNILEEDEENYEFRLAPTLENATHPETRFLCRFHYHNPAERSDDAIPPPSSSNVTLSEYLFNYEYVHWRKNRNHMPMVQTTGKDTTSFWLSTLLFKCPIPKEYQSILRLKNQASIDDSMFQPRLYLDIIPIRTPVRHSSYLLTEKHVGPTYIQDVDNRYDTMTNFGTNHILPKIKDSGRWENIPICPRHDIQELFRTKGGDDDTEDEEAQNVAPNERQLTGHRKRMDNDAMADENGGDTKPYRLILCTWTSASYTRRGDATRISDSGQRLLEWIEYHWMVGFEHIFIYDNSPVGDDNVAYNDTALGDVGPSVGSNTTQTSELQDVIDNYFTTKSDNSTPGLSIHRWPAQVCNNNRPQHANPGERSSQYAAEASCRTRYGPLSDWLAFIDTDEYLVPMKTSSITPPNTDETSASTFSESALASSLPFPTWHPVLDEMEKKQLSVLKMLSSRGRPRYNLMEIMPDQSTCVDPTPLNRKNPLKDKTEPCLGKRGNETFLKLYSCEFIRPPKPDRFARAMKQIYRTDHVLSHFVHYSTITVNSAQTYEDFIKQKKSESYIPGVYDHRWEKSYASEIFLNELTQGALVHSKSILPSETKRWSAQCYYQSKYTCNIGIECAPSVKFIDELHKTNGFLNDPDDNTTYCNCWTNPVVDNLLAPALAARIQHRQKLGEVRF